MTKLTEDGLRQQLHEIANWTGPIDVPAMPTAEVTMLPLTPVHNQRARQVWAVVGLAAAMVAALVAVSTIRPDPTPFADGRWLPMAEAPIPPRSMPATAWTGEEVIVVGGEAANGEWLRDAAAYNPTTNRWRRLPDAPAPVGPGSQTALTPDVLVVALPAGGGTRIARVSDSQSANRLAFQSNPLLLDRMHESWRVLEPPGEVLLGLAALDDEVIALSRPTMDSRDDYELRRLDRSTDAWPITVNTPSLDVEALQDVHAWQVVSGFTQVAFLPRDWLLTNGLPTPGGFTVASVVEPVTPLPPPPLGRPTRSNTQFNRAQSLATGSADDVIVLLALASDDSGGLTKIARRYGVSAQTWTPIEPPEEMTTDTDLFDATQFTAVERSVVLSGGARQEGFRHGDLESGHSSRELLHLDAKRWATLPKPNIDLDRVGHLAVWTGRELVLWGGLRRGPGAPINRVNATASGGARFVPAG